MPEITPAAPDIPASRSNATPVAHDFRLPLRTSDFDAGLPALLHAALEGEPVAAGLAGLCEHLGRALKLRLAVLSRRTDGGTFALEATSHENGLWLELQHIPERWDGGLASQGPAAAALRAQSPVRMSVRDDGFALWRTAATGEMAHEVLAIPLVTGETLRVLELYFDGDIARGATAGTLTVGRLISKVQGFIADLATIERQRLLASALASAGNAAFITDLEGTIVWSNAAFSALSGYSEGDVRGRNPSVLRSGQQGLRYYRELWATIRAGKVWSGETVDRAKDGSTYTIQQTISPVANDGRITHYVSVHQDIGAQRRARERLELASHVSPDTGLLTRAAFVEAFETATMTSPERPAALVVVTLRGLQRAAPALGDEFAALVSRALGRRVREVIGEPDLTGGFGAFEYALLLRGDVDAARVEARLRTLREKLAEPLPSLGALPELDIHCGIAGYPAHGRTFRELWLKADRGLADEPYRRADRGAPH